MTEYQYKRVDLHQQMLVDTGIVLARSLGNAYARQFLVEMGVDEAIIQRVVLQGPLRRMSHLPALPADETDPATT